MEVPSIQTCQANLEKVFGSTSTLGIQKRSFSKQF